MSHSIVKAAFRMTRWVTWFHGSLIGFNLIKFGSKWNQAALTSAGIWTPEDHHMEAHGGMWTDQVRNVPIDSNQSIDWSAGHLRHSILSEWILLSSNGFKRPPQTRPPIIRSLVLLSEIDWKKKFDFLFPSIRPSSLISRLLSPWRPFRLSLSPFWSCSWFTRPPPSMATCFLAKIRPRPPLPRRQRLPRSSPCPPPMWNRNLLIKCLPCPRLHVWLTICPLPSPTQSSRMSNCLLTRKLCPPLRCPRIRCLSSWNHCLAVRNRRNPLRLKSILKERSVP